MYIKLNSCAFSHRGGGGPFQNFSLTAFIIEFQWESKAWTLWNCVKKRRRNRRKPQSPTEFILPFLGKLGILVSFYFLVWLWQKQFVFGHISVWKKYIKEEPWNADMKATASTYRQVPKRTGSTPSLIKPEKGGGGHGTVNYTGPRALGFSFIGLIFRFPF